MLGEICMKQDLTFEEKRIIAEKYHRRLVTARVLFLASIFILLALMSSIQRLTDFYFKVGFGVSIGGFILSTILKIALSTCPFCQHQLFHPGRRRDNFAMPTQCPKCGEKLF